MIFARFKLAACVQAAMVAIVGAHAAVSQAQTADRDRRPTRPTTAAFEVRLRGPIHEGFAQPAVLDATDLLLVSKRPPPALREFPPVIRPAAAATLWLPGYWGWDEEQRDFVWVSGVWRLPPPGMRWIPGYWSARDEQFAWTPGFWSPHEASRLSYRARPPAYPDDEYKPSAGRPDRFYIPGYWSTASQGFDWRRGHWSPFHTGWVWMPTRSMPTPVGSLLARGYWDYPLAQRGVLFAPVSPALGPEKLGTFTPQMALDVGNLSEFLFVWPAYGHYCFGDYFGGAARQRKIEPWFAAPLDPLYTYERWQRSSAQPGWQDSLVRQYRWRQKNAEFRPVRRLGEEPAAEAALTRELTVPLEHWFRTSGGPLPLTALSSEARTSAAQAADAIRRLADTRARVEVGATGESADGRPRALALPRPAAPPAPDRGVPRVGTTGEYIPGVAGRQLPGQGRRTLPGMAGRNMPGVDTGSPGVVAPGVLPGADTRTMPGAELSKPQLPQRP